MKKEKKKIFSHGLINESSLKPQPSVFSAFICAPNIFRRIMLSLVLITLVFLTSCTYLFFKPSKQFVHDPATQKYAPEDIYFKSSDGLTLHGWYFRAKEARGTILICHGNVENISTHVRLDLWLIEEGYNLFIFDYRGYGKSDGDPTVKGINRDTEAALETALFRLSNKKNDSVIVFGKSLGGAAAVYTVSNSPHRNRVKAVILDSTFSSYRRIAREKIAASIIGWPLQYPLSLLVTGGFSPEDHIKKIAPVPVLIIHGNRDEIVPSHHGRTLYDAALQPKDYWELKVPGHVTAQADESTRKKLLQYLDALNTFQ